MEKEVVQMAIKITDKEFFTSLLDYEIKELAGVKCAAEKEDFSLCRKLFSAYVQDTLNPDKFFETLFDKSDAENKEELIENAEKACRHYMVSCGIPCDFGDNAVEWESNPTPTEYKEWTYQINRHMELLTLAKAYRLTGEKRYASACKELFRSWTEEITCPEISTAPGKTKAWRTIEAGIRMGQRWPEIFHTFYKEFSPDTIVDWCKSVYEHGVRLFSDHSKPGNWLLMEMNGLLHIGVLNPWLRDSKKWQKEALRILEENLFLQVYPDGAQYELATDYQLVVIKNYAAPVSLCNVYGIEYSDEMLKTLKKLLMFYVCIMRPDRKSPSVNDGSRFDVPQIINRYKGLFEKDETFEWIMGNSDKEPSPKSFIFEYPGFAMLRSGWGEDDSFVFFDGGEFGKAHQHEDKLSVIFYADGKEILVDPGNYAYDDLDPMRHHIILTQSHNCIRVDGKDQNRRALYKWIPEKINKKSDLRFRLSETVDAARAVYDEGYGACGVSCERLARQERSIYFVKKMGNLRPFLIVADRLTSDKERNYEVMWHLDTKSISAEGLRVTAESMHLIVPEYNMDTAGLQISYGVKHLHEETFHLQGWTCDSAVKHDYRPIYTAAHILNAKDIRHVTVLYPDGGKELYIKGVEASQDINDTTLALILSDGTRIDFDEKEYLD